MILSDFHIDALTMVLSSCSTLQSKSEREQLVSMLPDSVRNLYKEQKVLIADLRSIVVACNSTNRIMRLLTILEMLEGKESIEYNNVWKLVEEVGNGLILTSFHKDQIIDILDRSGIGLKDVKEIAARAFELHEEDFTPETLKGVLDTVSTRESDSKNVKVPGTVQFLEQLARQVQPVNSVSSERLKELSSVIWENVLKRQPEDLEDYRNNISISDIPPEDSDVNEYHYYEDPTNADNEYPQDANTERDFNSIRFYVSGKEQQKTFNVKEVFDQLINSSKHGSYYIMPHFTPDVSEIIMLFDLFLSRDYRFDQSLKKSLYEPLSLSELEDYVRNIELQKKSVVIISLSNIPINHIYSSDNGTLLSQIATRLHQLNLYCTTQKSKIVIALPRFFLFWKPINDLINETTGKAYVAASLFVSHDLNILLNPAIIKVRDEQLRSIILKVSMANSSSLAREIEAYIDNLGPGNSELSDILQNLSLRLFRAGYIEPAYRLELFIRSFLVASFPVSLELDVYSLDENCLPVENVVSVVDRAELIPEFAARAIVEGEPGSGISTFMRSLECHWAIPGFHFQENKHFTPFIPVYLRGGEIHNSDPSALLQDYFKRNKTWRRENVTTGQKMETHEWLSEHASLQLIESAFSSPFYLAFDDLEESQMEVIKPMLMAINGSNPNTGICTSWKENSSPLNEPWMQDIFRYGYLVKSRALSFEQITKMISEGNVHADVQKIMGLIDSPIAENTRNPFLLKIISNYLQHHPGSFRMNTWKLLQNYVESKIDKKPKPQTLDLIDIQLPHLAISLKTKSSYSIDKQAISIGAKLLILNNDGRFYNQVLEDYFAAKYLLGIANNYKNFNDQVFMQCFALSTSRTWYFRWKNVFRILAGALDKSLNYLLVNKLSTVNPRLSHECLWESVSKISTEELRLSPSVKQLLPALTVTNGLASFNFKDALESAISLGALDPRVLTDNIFDNMLALNGSGTFVGKYPVTNIEYLEFIEANGNNQIPRYWHNTYINKPNYPVVGISIFAARAYCSWLGTKINNEAKNGKVTVRLPMIGEWDLASDIADKFLVTTLMAGGAGTENTQQQMEAESQRLSESFETVLNQQPELELLQSSFANSELRPVGVFPPNSLGYFDMIGHVWQWCETDKEPSNEKNNEAWVKGGPFRSRSQILWSVLGGQFDKNTEFHQVGFRIIIEKK